MAKLKLGPLADDKPLNATVELPAQLHHDYGCYLNSQHVFVSFAGEIAWRN